MKPLQRAGNRRYYRPADVDLARKIHLLLNQEGYTVRGVQKLLRDKFETPPADAPMMAVPDSVAPEQAPAQVSPHPSAGVDLPRLIALRDRLANALDG